MFLPYPCIFHIRAVLDKSTAADIAAAFVSSRLDYANSVFFCSPLRCLTRLQRIQNYVARIVLHQPSLSSWDTLQQLHWLPVKWRIQFTLAFLTYKVLHTGTLSYLSERLHPTFLLAPCDHPSPLTFTHVLCCSSSSVKFFHFYSSFVSNLKFFSKTSKKPFLVCF